MLVVMRSDATPAQITRVVEAVAALGLTAHPLPGTTRTAIGMTGNTAAVDRSHFEVLPGVEEAIRVTKAYKLASREMKKDDTTVRTPHRWATASIQSRSDTAEAGRSAPATRRSTPVSGRYLSRLRSLSKPAASEALANC